MLMFASSEHVEHIVCERVVYRLTDARTSSAARARLPPDVLLRPELTIQVILTSFHPRSPYTLAMGTR